MKCPGCGRKLSTKNYDAVYEWYECPKCEGCFTYDEILEGGINESSEFEGAEENGNSGGKARKKTGRGRGKERAHTNGADAGVQEALRRRGPVAKGKKRQTEIAEDEEAIAEYEAEILKPKVKQTEKHHRDELDSAQVLGIWQDEIQDIYEDMGMELDEHNARDKALILWREIHFKHGANAREQEVEHALCKEHA